MSGRPALSVIVCSRDRPQMLTDCLAALAAAAGPDDEVVVIDSASTSAHTAEAARASGVRCVRVEKPGLSHARNVGVAATQHELIAFTDDDCLPEPGWADAIAGAFANPAVGVVLGRLLPAHPRASSPADDPGESDFDFNATFHVDVLGAGANMAFRRRALADVEGFDCFLGAGTGLRSGEDHDAVWRAVRGGWLGRYAADARVVHQDWRSPWALTAMRYGYGLGAGAIAAKLAKIDPHVGWPELRRRVWDKGLRQGAADLAKGWERPAAGDVLYAVGVVVGAAHVLFLGLDRGHVASPL